MSIRNLICMLIAVPMFCTSAWAMEDAKASVIEDAKASVIEDAKASGIEDAKASGIEDAKASGIERVVPQPPRAVDSPPPDSSMFGRDWRLYVPGAVYTNENVVAGTRTLHVSPGSGKLPHVLNISANGTYVWTAYGQVIRGDWVPGDRDYPVLLQNGYEGKNWKAKMRNGRLLLWDGNSLAGQFHGR